MFHVEHSIYRPRWPDKPARVCVPRGTHLQIQHARGVPRWRRWLSRHRRPRRLQVQSALWPESVSLRMAARPCVNWLLRCKKNTCDSFPQMFHVEHFAAIASTSVGPALRHVRLPTGGSHIHARLPAECSTWNTSLRCSRRQASPWASVPLGRALFGEGDCLCISPQGVEFWPTFYWFDSSCLLVRLLVEVVPECLEWYTSLIFR